MTNKRSTKRALALSFISLLLCVSMFVGTTFAWFTDNVSSTNNIIKAGNLDVELYYQNDTVKAWKEVDSTTNVFKENTLWEPGHTEVVYLKVKNAGTLALKYQLAINVAAEKKGKNVFDEMFSLSDYIQYTVVTDYQNKFENREDALKVIEDALKADPADPAPKVNSLNTDFLRKDISLKAGEETTFAFVVYMPTTVGNEANYKSDTDAPYINLGINLFATQYTYEDDSFDNQYDKDAEYPSWSGLADTTWYNKNEDVFTLVAAEQVAGLAELVDAGETFEGKTVRLGFDIDLAGKVFEPIGSYRNDKAFKGTLDGQGHTISNLSQNTWALNNGYYYGDLGLGLFGLVEDATIKNLTMDGADISGESALVGIVAATAYGDMVFENITVKNSQGADYQYYAGGIVGWASGDHKYINCDVDETTVIGGQWGDFNNANGGIIGGISSSGTFYLKDCDVACQIDVPNDVVSAYQWYSYRRSGMLIGDSNATVDDNAVTTAAAPNLTCENVTVTYGEWANYTYCEFAGTGYPFVRVQGGISVDAYSNVRYGHPTDANGNTVVDDNHVHNAGEKHHELIAFDQLYGGDTGDRYCTYGAATHPGVAVIYPKTNVTAPIDGNIGRETYEGDLFDIDFTDGLFVKYEKLTGNATISLNKTYETVALEDVTADVNGNLITSSADNTIILHNCEITLDDGEMLIVTTNGATVGQVMIHNVTVNGELLTQATAAQYMQGVNWYEVW